MREGERIEGPAGVGLAAFVPLECANTDLKRVHARTVVLELLVAVLDLVEGVHLVLIAYREPTELSVEGDKVSRLDGLDNEGELVSEVATQNIHLF